MIYANATIFMQRVLLTAANGYFYYTCGKIEPSKFEKLREKFQTFYSVDQSKSSRHRMRKNGAATTFLHACLFDQKIHFCLMSCSGKGRVHERETLVDLNQKNSRITSPCGRFQLLCDNEGWTWSMTQNHLYKLRERIHLIAALPPYRRTTAMIGGQPRDIQIEKFLDQIYVLPGFRLIRKDVGKLVVYLKREWTRLRPSSGPQPSQRTFLQYIRMLPTREKSATEKMAANTKKRAAANGQTVEERQLLLAKKRDFHARRSRFREALRQSKISNV